MRDKLETELKFLRNQINPHFLLNTLNNIYALARKGSEETAEVVLRLSELLQFMLYQSGGKFITLRDEIKVLEGYLALEMIRYNDRLSVSLHKETDKDSYLISPLLLLPFVENAFKHGVSAKPCRNIAVKSSRMSRSPQKCWRITSGRSHSLSYAGFAPMRFMPLSC